MRHIHSHSEADKAQVFGIAALAAGVGAIVALLFSAKSGPETRSAIRDRLSKVKNSAKDYRADVNDTIEDISQAAEQKKDEIIEKVEKNLNKSDDK